MFSIILLLVVIGIIVGIVALVRRRGGGEADPGIGTVRRLYYYGLAFVALMVAASGVTFLVASVAEAVFGARVLAGSATGLALGLALTIVGAPIWLFQWRLGQRAAQTYPVERDALLRKLYLYVVMGVAATVAAGGLVSLVLWVLGRDGFEGTSVALPLVWGAVWVWHRRAAAREPEAAESARTVRRLYVYLIALYGLLLLATGMTMVLHQVLSAAYDALFSSGSLLTQTSLWGEDMRAGIPFVLVGGAWWWWHWYREARDDASSLLRQVYLHLLAVLGSAITVVASLSVLLYHVLQWFIGVPDAVSGATHFGPAPGALSLVIVGGGVWLYHWAVVQQEASAAPGGPQAAQRVYRYVVAALGLGTLAPGLVTLLATMLGVVVREARPALAGADWWHDPLALAITLIVVGTPVWTLFWLGAQRQVVAGDSRERVALSRQVFIYLVFGVAALVTLGGLSSLLFMLFRDLLEGDLGLDVLRAGRWSIALLLTAGVGSVYYGLVLREDRAASAAEPWVPAPPVRKAVVVLGPEAAEPFVRGLEARLGYRVRRWRRVGAGVGGPVPADDDVADVERRIAEAPTEQVLVIVTGARAEVIPYRDG